MSVLHQYYFNITFALHLYYITNVRITQAFSQYYVSNTSVLHHYYVGINRVHFLYTLTEIFLNENEEEKTETLKKGGADLEILAGQGGPKVHFNSCSQSYKTVYLVTDARPK